MDTQEIFHVFMDLPYDLRYYIYSLATPRRVVHVAEGPMNVSEKGTWRKEGYDSYFEYAFDKFYNQMLDGSPNFNSRLHPDLANFAHNWRHRIPWASRRYEQTSLEAYGFSSNRPVYQPWQTSTDVPSIPTDWLMDFPELAFELTRESALYSAAGIPVFLHVSVESRQALMQWGYHLSFATRTAGPRTWFHPNRDRLYIPHQVNSFPRQHWSRYLDQEMPVPYPCIEPGVLLSGCHWDIGQYGVQDLRHVKHLILGNGAEIEDNDELANYLQNILPLLSNLEELYFENWSTNDIIYWFADTQISPPVNAPNVESSAVCIPAGDIDVLGSVYWAGGDPYRDWPGSLLSTGYNNEQFNRYKEAHSDSYHDGKAYALEAKLHLWRSRVTLAQNQKLQIPTIRHSHLCPEALAESLIVHRHRFWKLFQSLDDDYIQLPDFRTTFSKLKELPRPFQIQWHDILYAGREMEWSEYISLVQRWNSGSFSHDWVYPCALQAWYLNRFAISEPHMTIL
ncbi:uncharacterized protein NECHADRAFT_89286 [Fusarium vanettenii 77-13-4]|uniref:2EXR domain-containing protein n=1 Tax=Fusarium vanettenii (strain ATCC MYA-4622 / CBS 123669 / FGSC 9596 / NRRL 45880 / 77-13-4) TaxID=660122 RepID=C7ZQR4_FUSV7|nr:uncharacterized protein NECHADRAFT_89286 [Fusarium vanettenii 77-13-4]EEU33646.1 predicted protein [Fusarium vanettenii 77-13-4]